MPWEPVQVKERWTLGMHGQHLQLKLMNQLALPPLNDNRWPLIKFCSFIAMNSLLKLLIY